MKTTHYKHADGSSARLVSFTDGTFYCDLGFIGFNRVYKTLRGAEKYMEKNGFVVDREDNK